MDIVNNEEESILVSVVSDYYRQNCGADTKQHVNGIRYLKISQKTKSL